MAHVSIQIMSDLHLETHPSYDFDFPKTAPHLALLGDIGHVGKDDLFKFLERQLLRYQTVFFLLGNHEPYHLSTEFAKKRVQTFSAKVDKRQGLGKFVFLDQSRYDLDDQFTILGCTLFSRVTAEQARAVATRMVDFKDILHWDVSEHVDAHLEDVAWLNEQVTHISANEPQRKIAIFTHHSPTTDARANNPRYRGSDVSSGFVTDLSGEQCWKSEKAVLWTFGHTHFCCDFVNENGKRVVANQKGYCMFPKEEFRKEKVVTLDYELLKEDTR